VATMTNVDAGAYAISAKTTVDAAGGGGLPWSVTCTLDAGGTSTDSAVFAFDGYVDHESTFSMAVTRVFAATGSITLRCRSSEAANAHTSKIIAIKVDTVTRTAVSG
jgi:hypothetical protein